MKRHGREEQFDKTETLRRVEAVLRGAFAGSPTPLKDIPTRNGQVRKQRASAPKSASPSVSEDAASSASAKTARPRGKSPA